MNAEITNKPQIDLKMLTKNKKEIRVFPRQKGYGMKRTDCSTTGTPGDP